MTFPCGNEEYCGDKICDCGTRETKERLAANTVKNQMEYFQKRWGYIPGMKTAEEVLEILDSVLNMISPQDRSLAAKLLAEARDVIRLQLQQGSRK